MSVGLVVGAGVLAACQVGKVIIALPAVRADLEMSLTTAGFVLSSYTIVGAALGGLAGTFVERLGRRRVLVASLLVLGAGAVMGAASPTTALLLASRVVEGFGFMGVVVAGPSLIANAAGPANRRLSLGLWGAYMPLGQVIAIASAPVFLATVGWRGLWVVNAALLFGYAGLARSRVEGVSRFAGRSARSYLGEQRDDQQGDRRPRTRTLRSPGPLLLSVAFGMYSLQYLAVIGFLPTIYAAGGMSGSLTGLLTATVVLGNVGGNVAGGWLLHRGMRAGTLIAASAATTGSSVLVLYSDWAGFGLSYLAALVFSTVGGLLPASVFGAVPSLAPSHRDVATTNGMVVQASNLGSIVGPPAVAMVAAQAGGWSMSPLVLTTAAVVSLGAGTAVRARESRPRRA